jgi:hypothetical protein
VRVNAIRRRIGTAMAGQHEIDADKVRRLVEHLRSGGELPPVVVAMYADKALPLDGHHRLCAYAEVGQSLVDAWVIPGQAFDRLCARHRDAERFVYCDGVPALDVAGQWSRDRGY